MKKLIIGFLMIMFGIVFAGCGTAAKEIQARSQSEKTDIFTEVNNGSAIPKGFADLIIKAKVFLQGYQPL